LILCNKFDYFCTFTYNPDIIDRHDYSACKKKITQLFNNYKKRYSPDFRYIIVPEFHQDGAVHFHGLVSGIRPVDLVVPEYIYVRDDRIGKLKRIKNKNRYVDWPYYSDKLGHFSCSKIKHYEACALYITKYITKDLAGMGAGTRLFMSSTGLNRPELVFDDDSIPVFWSSDFENEFCKIKQTSEDYNLVSDYDVGHKSGWRAELGTCSDLRDSPDPKPLPENESDIFSRLVASDML